MYCIVLYCIVFRLLLFSNTYQHFIRRTTFSILLNGQKNVLGSKNDNRETCPFTNNRWIYSHPIFCFICSKSSSGRALSLFCSSSSTKERMFKVNREDEETRAPVAAWESGTLVWRNAQEWTSATAAAWSTPNVRTIVLDPVQEPKRSTPELVSATQRALLFLQLRTPKFTANTRATDTNTSAGAVQSHNLRTETVSDRPLDVNFTVKTPWYQLLYFQFQKKRKVFGKYFRARRLPTLKISQKI